MGGKKGKGSGISRFLFLLLVVIFCMAVFCFVQKRIGAELYAQEPLGTGEVEQPSECVHSDEAGQLSESAHSDDLQSEVKPAGTGVLFYEGLEVPVCGVNHNVEDHELRRFEHYSICYRETYEQAEWSAYVLSDSQLEKNASRSDDFRPDSMISTQSASLADYKGSGYDRGHLTPAADMAFSESAMSETFYMSNMSPQSPQLNRGTWKYLESQVRTWAEVFGRVYVVSGPVLEKPAGDYESIGKNEVRVPEYYYKVILVPLFEDETDRLTKEDAKAAMAIGFIMPNQKCEGSFWDYAVSVEEVEKRTGLDFYSFLDDSIEEEVENSFVLEAWK